MTSLAAAKPTPAPQNHRLQPACFMGAVRNVYSGVISSAHLQRYRSPSIYRSIDHPSCNEWLSVNRRFVAVSKSTSMPPAPAQSSINPTGVELEKPSLGVTPTASTTFLFSDLELWSMTYTVELGTNEAELCQHARYLDQTSRRLKLIVRTDTHNQPIVLLEPQSVS